MKKKILSGLGVLVVYGVVAFFFAHKKADDPLVVWALVFAAFVASINFGLGLFYNQKLLREQAETFTQAVMKNMLKRMVIVLAIFFTILLSMALNHFVFVAAFFILYFLLQIIEIKDLHKNS